MTKSALRYAGGLLVMLAHQGHAAPVRDVQADMASNRLFPALTAVAASTGPTDRGMDAGVAAMLAARRHRMADCNHLPQCLFTAAAWTAPERELFAAWVARTFAKRALPQPAVPDDGLQAQVKRELLGLNHILDVYGLGKAPKYPDIDGPGSTAGGALFDRTAAAAVALSDAARGDPVAALDQSAGLALALLDAADRNDAMAFEPLDERYNAAGLIAAAKVDWGHYAYTAIIVPGIGPDDLATPLSATGKLNVRLAAAQFADGVAPYIIVTGGMVHPRGTKYAEALQMRQALIDRFGVPAHAIIVEPYARHTTTNLRNVTRRLVALGAPLNKDALIVTYPQQSRYIESAQFAARNQAELGYMPGTIGTRLSPSELTFRPSPDSLRVDPMDPLDP